MIYANWKEFFEKDKRIIHINGFVTDLSRGIDLAQSFNAAITVEELYQHFKARLMDEQKGKENTPSLEEIYEKRGKGSKPKDK
jgi:thiamine pyrophosphate-dependent acetolactate synthase large subunit-like protein